MSRRPRTTDPDALEALYRTPTADLAAAVSPWWQRAFAAVYAWGRASVVDGPESEDQRRQRLERIALEHARRLTVDSMIHHTVRLSAAEIVEVLSHLARLTDVERWVRVILPPDGRTR